MLSELHISLSAAWDQPKIRRHNYSLYKIIIIPDKSVFYNEEIDAIMTNFAYEKIYS